MSCRYYLVPPKQNAKVYSRLCGFVPKKYKMEIEGKLEEIPLNVLVHQKFTKLTNKYNIIVNEVYKWDGPTGIEVRFDKK